MTVVAFTEEVEGQNYISGFKPELLFFVCLFFVVVGCCCFFLGGSKRRLSLFKLLSRALTRPFPLFSPPLLPSPWLTKVMQVSCLQKEKSAGFGKLHVEDARSIRFHATLHLFLSASHTVHWFTTFASHVGNILIG